MNLRARIELGIKTAKKRVRQLENASTGCLLCPVFHPGCVTHLGKSKSKCPADPDVTIGPTPIYDCIQYTEDIDEIIKKFRSQIEKWEEWLRTHK